MLEHKYNISLLQQKSVKFFYRWRLNLKLDLQEEIYDQQIKQANHNEKKIVKKFRKKQNNY